MHLTTGTRVLSVAIVAAMMLTGAASIPAIATDIPVAAESTKPPNIVLILTDDQRAGTQTGLPTITRELTDKGTTWTNAVVPTSWCCPSRASLLTGNFSHTTGVWGNMPNDPYGAWPAFHAAGWENKTLATALSDVGYRTGLYGKYLTSADLAGPGYIPPGWDSFDAFLGGNYNRYRLTSDTARVTTDRQYLTDELADRAVRFIRETPDDEPLFLYFSPFAPHHPYDPGPYAGASAATIEQTFEAAGFPAPTFNDPDLSGKPQWMEKLPRTTRWYKQPGNVTPWTIREVAQRQQDTLMGVDAAVSRIINALKRTDRARDTLFIFTSDNGYSWGEHRLQTKNTPYATSVHVPLIMRHDGHIPAASSRTDLVAANVDVHATILQAAGTKPHRIDGISATSGVIRDGIVFEAMNWRGWRKRPAYCGWRTEDALYVRYKTGEEELYDYTTDPHEQNNLAYSVEHRDIKNSMRAKAREHCDPAPPGYTWPDSSKPKPQPATNLAIEDLGDGWKRLRWVAPKEKGKAALAFRVLASSSSPTRVNVGPNRQRTELVTVTKDTELCRLTKVRRGLLCDFAIDDPNGKLKVTVRTLFKGLGVAESASVTVR